MWKYCTFPVLSKSDINEDFDGYVDNSVEQIALKKLIEEKQKKRLQSILYLFYSRLIWNGNIKNNKSE